MKTIIGLEIHVELSTKSKMFCSCSTKFGAKPNSQCCPICIGMPGTLPRLNSKVLEYGILSGLAFNCKIAKENKMDRKSYFYPDLVKGYQISQNKKPLSSNGFLEIGEYKTKKRIGINRIHIEEDTGKSIYDEEGNMLIDYNRSGIPLIEIVTEPDLSNAEEVKEFLEDLRNILKYIGVSDVKMEEGSLRCDVNINLESKDKTLKTKIVEIKNLNSFKSIVQAIEFEEKRQGFLLKQGENTLRETRRWDDIKNETILMRIKQTNEEYRYFPELDIPIINIHSKRIKELQEKLPELPKSKKERWNKDFKLKDDNTNTLISSPILAAFFEETFNYYKDAEKLSNWIVTELLRNLRSELRQLSDLKFTSKQLSDLLNLIDQGKVSNTAAKKIFKQMFENGKEPLEIAKENDWMQIDDINIIEETIKLILKDNPQSVEDYKRGKTRAFDYLVGQTMKTFKGRGNPEIINNILSKLLS